jgi:hypothetical protein
MLVAEKLGTTADHVYQNFGANQLLVMHKNYMHLWDQKAADIAVATRIGNIAKSSQFESAVD